MHAIHHTSACLIALCFAAESAHAQFTEARSIAMGGTGVASAKYWYAPLSNPALLASNEEGDTIGLLLPAVGALVADQEDLIEAVDEFQQTIDRLQSDFNNGNIPTLSDRDELISRLGALNNRPLTANAGASIVIALPLEPIRVAFVARSYLDSQAAVSVDAADTNRILTATQATDLDGLESFGNARSVLVTDIGISLATSFDLGFADLMVGVTPKYQRVDTFNYVIDVNNYDEDDFTDDAFRNDNAEFNADAGLALQFPLGVTLGVMVRDLDRKTFQTELIGGQQFDYTINPVVTVGAAFSTNLFTVTAEFDVNDTERFDLQDESRFVRAGIELDLFSWTQLRAGGTFDTEDQVEDFVTVGLGFSPLDLLHIDVAGQIGDGNTYGLTVQTAFTF